MQIGNADKSLYIHAMHSSGNSNILYLARTYDAPLSEVWSAWTDPAKTAKWWGPRGFTITTHSKELKVGGKWIYTMHGPDGVDYPNVTTYFVVEPLKRLEYDHGANENQKALFRVNVVFSEADTQTIMKMSLTFETPEIAGEMRKFIKQAGGNATWDRLGEYLYEDCHHKNVFLLNRSFEAPIAKVFDLFTNLTQVAKWQPPTGWSMSIINGSVEVGNSVFYRMNNSEFVSFGRSSYRRLEPPNLVAFVQEFCDETGKNSKHPGVPDWPARWLTTVKFVEEEFGVTRLTLISEILDDPTLVHVSAFLAERGGMTRGWNGSLDRLEELLRG